MASDTGFPPGLSTRVGFLLAQAHMAARAKADDALGRLGLTAKGFSALATLAGAGGFSQRELSRRIRVDPATMVGVIDSLEESGHIVRRRNAADRREYALHLTAKGRALYARADRALIEAENDAMRALDSRETRRLMDLLNRVVGEAAPTRGRKARA